LISSLYARKDPIPSLYVKSFDHCNSQKASIEEIFSHARRMAPCLLIFEDLEFVLSSPLQKTLSSFGVPEVSKKPSSHIFLPLSRNNLCSLCFKVANKPYRSLVTDETRSYFLNEVDGLESNDGILMIGSTNHLNSLDSSISKRPSRFDRKYHFKLPGEKERLLYCQFWRAKLLKSEMVDFNEEICGIVAKLTEGFSFAYLKELFVIVLLTIVRGGTGEEQEEAAEQEAKAAKDVVISTDSEEGNSIDGHVVVEHADAKAEDSELVSETETVDANNTAKAPAAKKKIMPQVEVPEALQSNVLLKVLKMQVKNLLDEMDNTSDEDGMSTGKLAQSHCLSSFQTKCDESKGKRIFLHAEEFGSLTF
jgi:transitional endoplasmic reticulum ATPase